MTLDDLTKMAYLERMPDIHDLKLPEWALWFRLRDLYRDFRQGQVDKEQAEQKKSALLAQYNQDRKDWFNAKEVMDHQAKLWKRIEAAGAVYAKEPTVENADKFFEAVYSCPRKDKAEYYEIQQAEKATT